jgi:hypothetical protein
MPTPEFEALQERGFSLAFLKSPLGSHTKLRRQYLRSDYRPRECRNCADAFGLPRDLPDPVLNAVGEDLRFMYYGTPLDNGYCSARCQEAARTPVTGDLFGGDV